MDLVSDVNVGGLSVSNRPERIRASVVLGSAGVVGRVTLHGSSHGRKLHIIMYRPWAELRRCVKVEVAVLGLPCPSLILIIRTISVDVRPH